MNAPRQRGAIAIALLALIASLAAALLLAGRDPAATLRAHAQLRSAEALAAARSALLGYAISYAEHHPGQGYGHLPCPDAGNDGSPLGACGSRDLGAVGRLPYRTLGLVDLRDGAGECLWYAVAGTIKANPKARVFNWDSPGQFDLVDAGGHALLDGTAEVRAAAVMIAPGAALPDRPRADGAAHRCSGDASAALALAGFIEPPPPAQVDGFHTFRQGTADSLAANDLLAWLTVDDIFDALRRRDDFAPHLDAIIDRAADALDTASRDAGFLDRHGAVLSPSLAAGPLPTAAALGLTDTAAEAHDNWRDQFRFLLCRDGGACLTATLAHSARAPGTATTARCRLALLFGGERIRHGSVPQTRTTAAERADPANYFEGDNAAALAGSGGPLTGYRHFGVADGDRPAHEDVIRCLA